MKTLWKIIRSFFVLIGLCVVALALFGAWGLRHAEPTLPDKMVLAYTFNGTPKDVPASTSWFARFMPMEPSLAEVTQAITQAAADDRVTGFAARLGMGDYNWADIQELRAAIATFRAAGKKTYVYAESYGDLYPGMAEYYLASGFDEIWLQPVGVVAITGFHAEVPYFKALLDRIGVTAQIMGRGEYKTAPEPALLEHMSNAQRETLHDILSSMMTDFFEGVSASRKMPAARIGQLVDGAPYTADEAKDRNLVDVVGYVDQLMAKLIPSDSKDKQELVNAMDYYYAGSEELLSKALKTEQKRTHKKNISTGQSTKESAGQSVALVYITGMIIPESDHGGGLLSERAASADDIAAVITDATQDDSVGAIIVRVDSPGGSPSASETIRRAIEVARRHGKYVVVSMGSEAASGGYWVSVDADKIFALPGTLTGSIGVFGGKPDMSGLWTNLDVNWDSVKLGANAGMWSPNKPYDPEGQAAVGRMLDDIYSSFIARVAKGRNFAPEVVEAMAGGRVWTGRQAKENGLIDEIGGLSAAMDDVAAHLGIPSRDDLEIYTAPDEGSPLDDVMGFFTASSRIMDGLRPYLGATARVHNPSWGAVYQDKVLP